MLIYNTTYLVADNQIEKWMRWLREDYLPFMLESGFSNAQVAKVLTSDPEQEGSSISVQFHVADVATLNRWSEQYAEESEREFAMMFGSDVLSFTTVLEIL